MTCPISAPKRALTGSSLRRTVPRTRVRLGPPITAIAGSNNPSTRIPYPDPRCREKGPKSHRNTHPKGQSLCGLSRNTCTPGTPASASLPLGTLSVRRPTYRPVYRSATRTVFLACHPPPSWAGHSDSSSRPRLPGPVCRPSGWFPANAALRFASGLPGWRAREAACR